MFEKIAENQNILEQNRKFKRFFCSEFVTKLLKFHLGANKAKEVIIKHLICLFAKDIDNLDLAQAMEQVFDDKKPLISDISQRKEYDKWRYRLAVGDRVETLKHNNYEDTCKCWAVAIITHIYKDNIELKFEDQSERQNIWVNRFSVELEYLGKNSYEYIWKEDLKIGDQVQALNKDRNWYPSTILDIQDHFEPDGR